MTALRVFQSIRSATALATEALRGVLRVGTQTEVEGGSLDDVVVTPKKLTFGFTSLLIPVGYIVFPKWLGGLIIQWGVNFVSGAPNNTKFATTFPIPFPNAVFRVIGCNASDNAEKNFTLVIGDVTTSGFNVAWGGSAGTSAGMNYIAIGR
ncbi:hypothetical protein D9M68_792660 [compost metagenome]